MAEMRGVLRQSHGWDLRLLSDHVDGREGALEFASILAQRTPTRKSLHAGEGHARIVRITPIQL